MCMEIIICISGAQEKDVNFLKNVLQILFVFSFQQPTMIC
jgi:hypothetical protein